MYWVRGLVGHVARCPCSALRRWSKEGPRQPVQHGLSCSLAGRWGGRSAQASPISFFTQGVPREWIDYVAQALQSKVRSKGVGVGGGGECNALSSEVLAPSLYEKPPLNIVGERLCSEEKAS